MAYTEIRGGVVRVRWKQANGKYTGGIKVNEKTGEPFASEEEAKQYGTDQETLIRLGLRKDKTKIQFGEWAGIWYAGLDLEPSTMATYRSVLQSHLMPHWEFRDLDDIRPEEIDPWERSMVRTGYKPRTAKDSRDLLSNILGSAVPRFIEVNPAARKRGKGRKGLRRVQAYQQAEKVWASPLEALLIAERAALAAGDADVFWLLVTKSWTGMRWSEVLALSADQLMGDAILYIDRKLYQITKFYLGFPKDGSLRKIGLPPFLDAALGELATRARTCACTGWDKERPPIDGADLAEWCDGRKYLFLSPGNAHYERGAFSSSVMRPAADGVHPGRKDGGRERPARPVLADVASYVYGPVPKGRRRQVLEGSGAWPGVPVHWPWPYAEKGAEFIPPRGRGRPDWSAWPDEEQPHLVTWRPIRAGLTPHGLRHGHQTWMDDAGIHKALKTMRMGHEDPSMAGRYGHVTEGMQEKLDELLQALWENALGERFALWPTSAVPYLDRELARWRLGTASKVVSHLTPRNSRRALTA